MVRRERRKKSKGSGSCRGLRKIRCMAMKDLPWSTDCSDSRRRSKLLQESLIRVGCVHVGMKHVLHGTGYDVAPYKRHSTFTSRLAIRKVLAACDRWLCWLGSSEGIKRGPVLTSWRACPPAALPNVKAPTASALAASRQTLRQSHHHCTPLFFTNPTFKLRALPPTTATSHQHHPPTSSALRHSRTHHHRRTYPIITSVITTPRPYLYRDRDPRNTYIQHSDLVQHGGCRG
jgi:hypothetical protein